MPWSAWIHTGFHVYGATQDTTKFDQVLNYGTITRYGHTFQSVRLTFTSYIMVLNPAGINPGGLGWSAFARHY